MGRTRPRCRRVGGRLGAGIRNLDPILAAFVVILGATAVVITAFARDWDQHSTFEQRELARARKRGEKWDRNKDARDRDRVRWEAHQARQARKSAR